jgi:PAS domain S-box-containing protein
LQAERATAHLAAIVKSSDDAIISKDLTGTVMSWNQGAERLFGYRAEEMIGQPILRLIPKEKEHEEHEILSRISKGERIEHYHTVRCRKDGTLVNVSLTISPLFDAAGKVIGASKIARDITKEKRAEEALRDRDRALTAANDELNQQKAGLAEANKELQSFSYSVSHDLRAPLRTIDAYVRIVEEDHGTQLNDEAQRCLGIIRRAAGQAGELIDDLLEFSRLGRVGMDLRPTKMTELAREAAAELALAHPERTVDVTIGDLPLCNGDWRLLKLVWANLLSNAFKFTRHRMQAQVEVGWLPDDRQPDAIVYYVKDNGVGFDMKYVQKLFGVFQRLHLKDEFEGTGVGLAIVHRIVQRHDGRVWAEGKIDGGATFFFSLRKATR